MVQAHRFFGLIQQRQNLTIHGAGDIEETIDIGVHRHQRAEFIVGPVLDDQKALVAGGFKLRLSGSLEIKQIGPIPPRPDLRGAVDQKSLAQAALDLPLALAQKLTVAQVDALRAGAVDAAGKGPRVQYQSLALLGLIGFGRRER